MRILLDSSAIIEFLRGNSKVMNLIEQSDVIFTSVICAYEVLVGEMYRDKKGLKSLLKEVKELLRELNPMPLVMEDCIKASEISSALMVKGKVVSVADALISAQAIRRNLMIVTKDLDFNVIKEIEPKLMLHIL